MEEDALLQWVCGILIGGKQLPFDAWEWAIEAFEDPSVRAAWFCSFACGNAGISSVKALFDGTTRFGWSVESVRRVQSHCMQVGRMNFEKCACEMFSLRFWRCGS